MRFTRHALLLALCPFLTVFVFGFPHEQTAQPEDLLAKARRERALWSPGGEPVSQRAEIQVLNGSNDLIKGTYSLDWASTSQWREQINVGNYARLRVRDANGYWQKSSMSYQPEVIFHLDSLIHQDLALKLGSKETLGKLKKRQKDGVSQQCAEIKIPMGTERILCFDDAKGYLMGVDYPAFERVHPPNVTRIEFAAFTLVGEKFMPFEARAFHDRKLVASFKTLGISRFTPNDPQQFAVPAGAEFWAACDDPQAAELANRVVPQYPPMSRANGEQGRVNLYAVIEADGTTSHITALNHAAPALEASATEAVRKWRYKPASCGQTPIRVESLISTDFSLLQ